MWYSHFTKTALRKHNLRIDLRVYLGDEIDTFKDRSEIESKIKSVLSSAIIKGLDIVGIVSRFDVQPGLIAQQQAVSGNINIKVVPGQDYMSADRIKAIFFNIQQNIKPGLNMTQAIPLVKKQGGKVMLYDLSRSVARSIDSWQSTPYEPDLVEIYNAHSKAYKDLDIDYPRVISSAARSGSELESIPVYTELPRSRVESLGILSEKESENFVPDYLRSQEENINA